ncbi:hypothetical protein CMUS01_09156 [Colletotrichum musicola]|uniref:Uncharacterized protein n=1 Tax=Colletotrichum musicola TaxID=2175873 RepID=A0A8H6KAF9_9PEZI|nr:hypothetical protein CMUS01_09156 [Colletotrichum musicola]
MKFSAAAVTTLFAAFAAAFPAAEPVPVPAPLDYAALAKTFQERSLLPRELEKRCDYDFYETCMGTCNNPTCPACNIGCVIGCCGSTKCC